MGVGGRREGAWERAAVHSAAATWGRALDKGQHERMTRPLPSYFSRVNGYFTDGRCDADAIEVLRFKRRPVRVEGATGRPWGPITHRSVGGKVGGGGEGMVDSSWRA